MVLLCLAWRRMQRLRVVSSRSMADAVFSNPELQQCIKQDLLWQLRLAQDIRQDEVSQALPQALAAQLID